MLINWILIYLKELDSPVIIAKHSEMLDYLIQQSRLGRTVIFDLDDTLYSEEEFLKSVYSRIAGLYGTGSEDDVYDYLLYTFKNNGRDNIFDKMFRKFPNKLINLETCLTIMRSPIVGHSFDLYPWVSEYAKKSFERSISIITNGTPQQQKNKIKYLNLDRFFDLTHVAYANEYQKKPHPDAYHRLSEFLKMRDPIYVGDSNSDKVFAKNCGIEFLDSKLIEII